MSKSLGSLLVDIGASTARLEKDLAKATGMFQKSAKKFQNIIGGIGFAYLGTKLLKESVDLAIREEKAIFQLEQRLKSTGDVVGYTSEQLQLMASSLQKVTTFGNEATLEAQALLLTFTKIRGDVFDSALKSIQDMSVAMGQDLHSSVIQVGKALNDPIKGLTALSRVGVAFTEQQKEQITTMVATGDVMGAQKIILKELQTEFGGAATAARQGLGGALGGLSNAFGDVLEKVGKGNSGLIGSINDLEGVISSPDFLSSAENLGQALATSITLAVEATTHLNTEIGTTAQWLAALTVGDISFWEYMTTGADEAAVKLKKFNEERAGANVSGPTPPDFAKIAAAAAAAEQLATEEAKRAALERGKELAGIQKEMALDAIDGRVNAWATGEAIQKEMELDAITSRVDAWVAGEALIAQVRAESSAQAREELFEAIETQKTMELNAISSRVDAWVKGEKDKTEASEKAYASMQNAVAGWAANFSSTLTDMAFGAKTTFSDILESFAKMITQMMIQRAIVEPMLGAMGLGATVASAKGNVFSSGKVQAFANGGVVSKPTLFPMANGAGLMGEAGPEAIMPLKRGRDGRLGVEGGGGGTVVQVMVNNAPAKVREERSQSGGKELVKIFIDAVDEAIGSGRMDKTFNRTFGLQRGGVR